MEYAGTRTGKGTLKIGRIKYKNVGYVVRERQERVGELERIKTLWGELISDEQPLRVFERGVRALLQLETGEELEIIFDGEASGPGWTPFLVNSPHAQL